MEINTLYLGVAENNDTPPPPSGKKGRRKGKIYKPRTPDEIKDPITGWVQNRTDVRRNYSYSISERIRERIDPDLLLAFHWSILHGINPVFETRSDGFTRVVPDPNPNSTTPTLQQKIDSTKWLTDRRDGLAPQSVHIDAMLRAKVQPEIPNEIMGALTPMQLNLLAQALLPPPPSEKNEEIIDAEFQESGQVAEGTDSPESVELQESCQVGDGGADMQ